MTKRYDVIIGDVMVNNDNFFLFIFYLLDDEMIRTAVDLVGTREQKRRRAHFAL